MEAISILQRIRDRGFIIKLEGAQISLAPKQHINDKMIAFIRKHKENLLTALYREQDEQKDLHLQKKRTLHQGRLEVLRVLIGRFLNNENGREMVNYQDSLLINDKAIEDYLDMELVNFDFDLEGIISCYNHYIPAITLAQCVKCGYRPLFCLCKYDR